jgi:4-amino-4-deoxy-L-arabinose transferase-like glycosyltransferase
VRRPEAGVRPPRPTNANLWRVLVVVTVAGGIALRIWVVSTAELGALDSDEAVPGLMARNFLHGELSTFYWGQSYGGTAEVGLLAVVSLLAGSSVTALRLVPVALSAIGAVLVWRIGRRTVGEPAATVAGLLYWIWPAYFVWRSTREYGYYGVLLVCGLTLVLLALRLRERPTFRDAAGFGVALGLGWWSSPQIALVAVPALSWLLWRRPGGLREVPVMVAGTLLAAAPWIAENIRSGWASLSVSPDAGDAETYWERLHGFLTDGLPTTVGLRVLVTRQWLPSPLLGPVAFWLLLASLAVVVVRRRRSLELVAAIVVPFPFLAALSGFTWYRVEPRYLGLLAPLLALLLAALLTDLRVAAPGLAVATLLSVVGLVRLADVGGFRFGGSPTTVAPVVRVLDEHGVTRAWADYWVAFRITFLTHERIVVAPVQSSRRRRYDELVARAPRAAHVFVTGGNEEASEGPALLEAGYQRVLADPYTVYVRDW